MSFTQKKSNWSLIELDNITILFTVDEVPLAAESAVLDAAPVAAEAAVGVCVHVQAARVREAGGGAALVGGGPDVLGGGRDVTQGNLPENVQLCASGLVQTGIVADALTSEPIAAAHTFLETSNILTLYLNQLEDFHLKPNSGP